MTELKFPKGAFRTIDEWRNFVSKNPGGVVYHAPCVRRGGMPDPSYGVQKLTTKPSVETMGSGRFSLKFENITGLATDNGSLGISWNDGGEECFLFKNFWDAYAHACKVEQAKNE